MFGPLKHWHQVAITESIQYGDLDYSKTEFLSAYQTMRDRTFKRITIESAWRNTGLFPFNPIVVFEKLSVQFGEQELPPLETPMTPICAIRSQPNYETKPFQTTPTFGNRMAHLTY